MQQIIDFVIAHKDTFIMFGFLIISEAMALNPSLKSNGIVDFFFKILKGEKDKIDQARAAQ